MGRLQKQKKVIFLPSQPPPHEVTWLRWAPQADINTNQQVCQTIHNMLASPFIRSSHTLRTWRGGSESVENATFWPPP